MRVVLITGNGRAFCVGADLKETAWRGETQDESRRRVECNQQQLAREMVAAPVPIIAAINGYALGGGLEIALAADLRIAGASARFGFPETTIGRFISGGASLLLPHAVGVAWAKRLVFTGEHLDADEARAIGLVEEVVEDERLLARAEELARTIAGNAPVSVALAKRVPEPSRDWRPRERACVRDRGFARHLRHGRQRTGRGRVRAPREARLLGPVGRHGRLVRGGAGHSSGLDPGGHGRPLANAPLRRFPGA